MLLRDFKNDTTKPRSYKDTGQSSEDTDTATKSYTYDDIVYMINKHTKMSEEDKKRAVQQFWQMYMMDAYIEIRKKWNE